MSSASSRPSAITWISLGVACFSMATAMYQGWLATRNMEIVQKDIARREMIRSCRDGIEAYFEAKLRIALLQTGEATARRLENAAIAVSRFAAIGTFLANVEGEEQRVRYTRLSRELDRLRLLPPAGGAFDEKAFFADADRLFAGMNEDCVRSARLAPV
jgi:hypothetical protein